jgi:hypothetical protein
MTQRLSASNSVPSDLPLPLRRSATISSTNVCLRAVWLSNVVILGFMLVGPSDPDADLRARVGIRCSASRERNPLASAGASPVASIQALGDRCVATLESVQACMGHGIQPKGKPKSVGARNECRPDIGNAPISVRYKARTAVRRRVLCSHECQSENESENEDDAFHAVPLSVGLVGRSRRRSVSARRDGELGVMPAVSSI